jgi:hypothetical protein
VRRKNRGAGAKQWGIYLIYEPLGVRGALLENFENI